jgi:KTSC domain
MQREPVESGLIVSIAYDAETQTLEVEFHKSKKQTANPVYAYTPFLPERWAEFSAEKKTVNPKGSVGKYFLGKIKTDKTLTVMRVHEGETSTTEPA